MRGNEYASEKLIGAIQAKKRTVVLAQPESEELRYLNFMQANANVGGPKMRHIVLRPDPRKIEAIEEFLHGTQFRISIILRRGIFESEKHVKEFMIRHHHLLGISDADVGVLQRMLGR